MDYWIIGLLDCWIVDRNNSEIHLSIYPSIHQANL